MCMHADTKLFTWNTYIDPNRGKILDFPYNCWNCVYPQCTHSYIIVIYNNWNIHSPHWNSQPNSSLDSVCIIQVYYQGALTGTSTYPDRRSCQTNFCRAGNSASNNSTDGSGTDAGTRWSLDWRLSPAPRERPDCRERDDVAFGATSCEWRDPGTWCRWAVVQCCWVRPL